MFFIIRSLARKSDVKAVATTHDETESTLVFDIELRLEIHHELGWHRSDLRFVQAFRWSVVHHARRHGNSWAWQHSRHQPDLEHLRLIAWFLGRHVLQIPHCVHLSRVAHVDGEGIDVAGPQDAEVVRGRKHFDRGARDDGRGFDLLRVAVGVADMKGAQYFSALLPERAFGHMAVFC